MHTQQTHIQTHMLATVLQRERMGREGGRETCLYIDVYTYVCIYLYIYRYRYEYMKKEREH
jgi:hypothetical protein